MRMSYENPGVLLRVIDRYKECFEEMLSSCDFDDEAFDDRELEFFVNCASERILDRVREEKAKYGPGWMGMHYLVHEIVGHFWVREAYARLVRACDDFEGFGRECLKDRSFFSKQKLDECGGVVLDAFDGLRARVVARCTKNEIEGVR